MCFLSYRNSAVQNSYFPNNTDRFVLIIEVPVFAEELYIYISLINVMLQTINDRLGADCCSTL